MCLLKNKDSLLHIHSSIIFSKNININLVTYLTCGPSFKFPQDVLYNCLFVFHPGSSQSSCIWLLCLFRLTQSRTVPLPPLVFMTLKSWQSLSEWSVGSSTFWIHLFLNNQIQVKHSQEEHSDILESPIALHQETHNGRSAW